MICRAITLIYILLAVGSLALIPISALGLFGVEPDPLAGVFALLLAMPWTMLIEKFVELPGVAANMALVAICLAANAAILALACRMLGRVSLGANRP